MNKSKIITMIGIIIIISLSIVSVSGFYTVLQSISALEQQKKNVENDLSVVNGKIFNVNDEINQVVENLEENISELEYLESGSRYELHDPSYSEVVSFISSDNTDKKEYIENVFECRHFAQEVNNNSEEQGIRCAYVIIYLSGPDPHACVAYNTTDIGMIYYDPTQFSECGSGVESYNGYNWRINLEVGKDYYADCIILPSGYYYDTDPDCIVEDFTLYW